jgi:bifunctional ADP-heptose synthase (sugar kinase/adenylyltransferase)
MSNKDTGGPAFPCTQENWDASGMTLRDYIVTKVLTAYIARGAELKYAVSMANKAADLLIKAKNQT